MRVVCVLIVIGSSGWADEAQDCRARGGKYQATDAGTGCLVKGAREGVWAVHHAGGQLVERSTWLHNRRDGDWVRYHDNCQVAERGRFANGFQDGAWAYWSPRGRKLREGAFVKGRLDGKWTFYDETTGLKQFEGPFVMGEAEGVFTEFLPNGTKWREVTFAKGKRVGVDPEACEKNGGLWEVEYERRREGCLIGEV
jgi:hypothetical protein